MKLIHRIALVLSLVAAPGVFCGSSIRQNVPGLDVRMRVVDGLTGQAITRARFSLTGATLQDGITGSGDSDGTLRLSQLPAGKYELSVEKAGYFAAKYAFSLTNDPSISFPEIAMTAKREIAGVVRWQDGEFAARAEVRVLAIHGGNVERRDDVDGTAVNDRGEFSFPSLSPGRYILAVLPPGASAERDVIGRVVTGVAPRLGIPSYYPGLSAPDARSIIDVRGVPSIRNVEMVIEDRQGTTLEGSVVPSSTAPMGTRVSLTLSSVNGLFSTSTAISAGGAFRLGPVPGGNYVLEAQSLGTQRSRTLQSISVGSTPLKDIVVSIPPPVAIAVHIEIDDPAVRVMASIRLQSENVQRTLTGYAFNGDFEIEGAVPGESYAMTLTSIPRTTYIAAVFQGSRELQGGPFHVDGSGDTIRVVLKMDGGVVEGVAKQDGRIFPKAFVVLAPKERSREYSFRTTVAADNGSFRLSEIAPGEYDLFIFDRNEGDDYLDDTLLRQATDYGLQVTVAPHSTQTAEPRLFVLPRR